MHRRVRPATLGHGSGFTVVLFEVGREAYVPSPKVDSVVIRLKIRKDKKFIVSDEKKFFSVVKCAFAQRRKTALNSISNTMGVSTDRLSGCMQCSANLQTVKTEPFFTAGSLLSATKKLFSGFLFAK